MNSTNNKQQECYDKYTTEDLIDLYLNDDLTEFTESIVGSCLQKRGVSTVSLLEERAKKLAEEEERELGQYSLFNYRRPSTKWAFIVGLPIYLYLFATGWSFPSAVMSSFFPAWVIFMGIEMYLRERNNIDD